MKKLRVFCVELDKWFDSIAEASRETGESISKIRYSLWESTNINRKGYTWHDEEYYEDFYMTLAECELL